MNMSYIHVGKRTYVDKKSIDAIEKLVDDLAVSAELGRNYGADMTFIPTVATDLADSQERVIALFDNCRRAGWKIGRGPYNQTAGQKFAEHLFGRRSEDKADIVALMCLDQFPLTKQEHWGALNDLAEKLRREGKTYVNGSRDVEVTLAVNKNNSERRIIHEMVHTFAGGTDQFRTEQTLPGNPHPAYARFGESTSGLYLLNRNGPFYPQLQAEVEKNEAIFKGPGFAIEYMTAILAGAQKQVSRGYVYAVRNPFYSQVSEEEEREKTLKWIGAQAKLLDETPVGLRIAAEVSGAHTFPEIEVLKEVFDGRLVDEVVKTMRESMSKSVTHYKYSGSDLLDK